jgi:phosphohistidine phosphatase SixA
VPLLLVRHARAVERYGWEGDDRLRPLDEKGESQAAALVELLASYRVDRIVTSPAVRCTATVAPLARARGLDAEVREELAEEGHWEEGAALVRSLAGTDAVVCGHGGLEHAVIPDPPRWKKAAVLVLDDALDVVDSFRP